ncbi:MAG: Ldh family oxidoreductase, partial [Xanthobacteraceae bacterium]
MDQSTKTRESAANQERIPAPQLAGFVARAFVAAGLPEADAQAVAGLMVEADLRGSDTHGVIRLPLYVRRLRAGGIKANPNIRTLSDRASVALIDGDNGMGHLVMRRAAALAIEKAKTAGIGWVGARMSNHAGPAALYVTIPLEHDMVGLYFAVGSNNHLPPWGGSESLLGTNPMAVAVPALEEPPIVLDMAPTVAAYGKVRLKAQRGEAMPVGWMIDREGKPLTDPKRADEGYLLPIGDYKGYGLSLIIALLAGALNRAAVGRDVIDFVKENRQCDQNREGDHGAIDRRVHAAGRVQKSGGRFYPRYPPFTAAARGRPHLAARRAEPCQAHRPPR